MTAPVDTRDADPATDLRRRLEIASQAIIIVWIVVYSIDTLPHLSSTARLWLDRAEQIITILFTIEYGIRFYTAPDRGRFVRSFFGIIDLLSILPFYLSFAVDLKTLRILRLLRLTRILKLGRYNRALQRLYRAWLLAKDEFVMFLFVAFLLIFVSAAGIHHFEHDAQPEKFGSIFDSLWWSISTLTTVGYGDVYPITAGGRIFTFLILMVGLGIIAIPTGLVTAALTEVRERDNAVRPISTTEKAVVHDELT